MKARTGNQRCRSPTRKQRDRHFERLASYTARDHIEAATGKEHQSTHSYRVAVADIRDIVQISARLPINCDRRQASKHRKGGVGCDG